MAVTRNRGLSPIIPYSPKQEQNMSFWQRFITDPVSVFTGLLTLVNAFFLIVSIFQWCALRKSAKVSAIAAEAAKKSANVAEKSLTDIESPALYPVIDATDFAKSLRWGRGPVKPVEVKLKNIGRLPGFPGNITCDLFAGGPDERIDDRHAEWFPEGTLARGETSMNFIERSIKRHDGVNVSDADCAAIVEGKQDVYLSGTLSYIDLFGTEYRQTFCLKWLHTHKAFMAFGPGRNKRTRKDSQDSIESLCL